MNITSRMKNALVASHVTLFLMSGMSGMSVSGHVWAQEGHEEAYIVLTDPQIKHAGIMLADATAGTIRETLPVYGQIVPNAEREQSVKARFSGVIRDIKKSVGDPVQKGEVLLTVEANESLKSYSITSALNGVITERYANVGEQTTDKVLFVVRDFSSLWVELSVFPKDINRVSVGQVVRIKRLDPSEVVAGKIIYIAPNGQMANQAISARVLVDNAKGTLRPGHFVNAQITLTEVSASVVVRNEAVQLVEDKTVIFVKGDEGFEPREITLGRTDGELTEVLNGLNNNEVYVSKNSFVLKSEMGKEDAEHGH